MRKLGKRKWYDDGEPLKCPFCRVGKFDNEASFALLASLFEIAKTLIVYDCASAAWGCTEKLSAARLADHEAVCEHRLSYCPGTCCDFKAPFKELAAHGETRSSGKFKSPCFTVFQDAKSEKSFFVWTVDLRESELQLVKNGNKANFARSDFRTQPAILFSQDPSVRACILTGVCDDGQFFTASVLWLENDYALSKRKENIYFKLMVFSCGCNSQMFFGEPAFQNWSTEKIESAKRQLKIHISTFAAMFNRCTSCSVNNAEAVLRIELIHIPKKKM
jgi:hypothetical protein